MIQKHLIAEAKEIYASLRWENPDSPGSGNIEGYGQRITSPGACHAFRQTPDGEYLLGVMDAYEEALNDDWLPFEIIGLSLPNARKFIQSVAMELEQNSLADAIEKSRACYAKLAGAKP